MNSSKSERKSRRSSILKPPKPRQPLQNVEVNVPSPENSPVASATKIKRRVSFAEKKHVKEFCDSMEQGTVWDNTYEESELSQRNSQNSNTEENICSVEFTNHQSQITIVSTTNYESINCESISTSVKSRYSSTDNEVYTTVSDDCDPRILSCDPNIQDSAFEMIGVQSTRIPFPTNHVESFKARQSVSESMVCTDPNLTERKPPCFSRADILCPSIIDSGNPNVVFQDSPNQVAAKFAGKDSNDIVPMDETMIGDLNAETNEENLKNNSMAQPKFAIFQDYSMEMSEGVSNPTEAYHSTTLTRMESKEESLLAAKEQTMEMKTMELTNALSKITETSKLSSNEFSLKELNLRPERSLFHDRSVEFIEVAKTNLSVQKWPELPPEKESIFHNNSGNLKNLIPNIPVTELQVSPPTKTKIFQNQSVDFTEIVQHMPSMDPSEEPIQGCASILQNESIDFTEAVPALPICNNKYLGLIDAVQNLSRINQAQKSPPEHTTIFQNESIDFTEAVPRMPIFNNKSLSFTEAVQNLSRVNLAPKSPPERTTIFHNKSVDFTEAIQNLPCISAESPLQSMTTFDNQSIDFTNAVQKVSPPIPTELTPIINNKSLVVEPFNRDVQKSFDVIPEPMRTTMNCDQLENFVQVATNIVRPNLEESPKECGIDERNISQSQRYSEFRGAIADTSGVARIIVKESGDLFEKNTANDAKGTIPTSQELLVKDFDPDLQSPLRKRSKSSENKLIDITAALPLSQFRWIRMQQCEGITDKNSKEINYNIAGSATSVPFETVHNFETDEQLPGKTSSLQDQSMEMTEALGCLPRLARESSAYSESYDNENLNRLQLLPSIFQIINKGEEKPFIPMIQDQSMEMTVVVSRSSTIGQMAVASETYISEHGERKKMALCDDSMDSAGEVKCSSDVHENYYSNQKGGHGKPQLGYMKLNNTGRTVVSRVDSMQLPGAVQFVPLNNTPFLDKENCPIGVADRSTCSATSNNEGKTIVFRNDGMELTGAVQLVPPSKTPFLDKENCPIGVADRFTCGAESNNEGRTIVFRNDGMELTGAVQLGPPSKTLYLDKENLPIGAENRYMYSARALDLDDQNSDSRSRNRFTGKPSSILFPSLQSNKENVLDPGDSEEQSQVANYGSDDITGVVAFPSQFEEEHFDKSPIQISGRDKRTLAFQNEEVEIAGTMPMPWSSDSNEGNRRSSSSDSRSMEQIDAFPIAEKMQRRPSQVVKGLFQNTSFSSDYREENQEPIVMSEKTGTEDLEEEIRRLTKSVTLEEEPPEFDQETFLRQQAQCMEDHEANSTASQNYESIVQSIRSECLTRMNRESLTVANWKMNASVECDDVSIIDSRCFPSKSLGELKNRAYTAKEFRTDETGYENTAAISIAPSEDFLETIMLEDLQAVEPPSFTLEDSAARDRELETSGMKIDSIDYQEEDELVLRTTKYSSNSSDIKLPEITETVNMGRIVQNLSNENIEERMERKRMPHSQMNEMKKVMPDKPILNASLSEIDDDAMTNHRRSSTVLTAAADFSSETPNGPSEKLRRGENVMPVDNKKMLMESANLDRYGSGKNFVSSTIIDDDVMGKLIHRGIGETTILAEDFALNEIESAVDKQKEQRNINKWTRIEEAVTDNDISVETFVHENPFDIMKKTMETLAESSETIWTINRLDESIVAFNFFANSIVLAIYLNESTDTSIYPIEAIEFLSQLVEDDTDPGVCLAHRLIMKKVDSASLNHSCRTFNDIARMLEVVSTEVKLGMDFMFDLDRLRNQNVIKFDGNRVTFMVRTTNINAGIILNITMVIKPFAEINSNDITVSYLLGKEKVRENDIKKLITNVKRDHRFLRYYMNDVKDYIDLMAETGFSSTSRVGCR